MVTTVLFDLDGTLLPMDQDVFARDYFKRLAAKMAPYGYDPEKLIAGVWDGTAAMVRNDGSCTNEERFWKRFCELFGEKSRADIPLFNEYYAVEFQQVAKSCGYNPAAEETVKCLKRNGICTVLATNPIFPAIATESRIRWAGLNPSDFLLYTTYENTGYCKPNPAYYQDILTRLHRNPAECLMDGNDVSEDMIAQSLGMQVFLLTDCIINKNDADISVYPHGDFAALNRFLAEVCGYSEADAN